MAHNLSDAEMVEQSRKLSISVLFVPGTGFVVTLLGVLAGGEIVTSALIGLTSSAVSAVIAGFKHRRGREPDREVEELTQVMTWDE